jgi:hypothetical protein
MTACNQRPPQGQPFHGTGVACHLRAGHRAPHAWEVWAAGPWIATFRDGPLADHDHDRVFAVGPIWEEMVLVELPGLQGWQIVAGDGIPHVRVPWEGEVAYRLDGVVGMAGADGEPVAYYQLDDERTGG